MTKAFPISRTLQEAAQEERERNTRLYNEFERLAEMNAQLIATLQDIAAMGKKAGSETARHRLIELGIDVPDYGSMT